MRVYFFFQAEDGIRDIGVTGVQTCALPIYATLLVECWVDPGGGVPPHIHPTFEEVFEVVEGEMTFTAGRAKKRVPAGESITVPSGTRHAYANRSGGPVYMRCTAKPARDRSEEHTSGLQSRQ